MQQNKTKNTKQKATDEIVFHANAVWTLEYQSVWNRNYRQF